MIATHKENRRILLVHDEYDKNSLDDIALSMLVQNLHERDMEVLTAVNSYDAQMVIVADPMIRAVLLDWELEEDESHASAIAVLDKVRSRAEKVPVFLFAERDNVADIPAEVLRETSDFIWLYEDTPTFISGRIAAAVKTYEEKILPPMFKALQKFSSVHEYSWHTPGHTGGTAFMKSPAGSAFFDFFGENLFRSDLSISVRELGSLLDHSGPIGASEKYAARVFGAHRTYHVTNGSSTSNRIIFMACVTQKQIALCDRNAHKSIEQALTMSGGIPMYLKPMRNFYGIIGPIPPAALKKEAIEADMAGNPLITDQIDHHPALAVITNSTYDGLCYNVLRVEELLGKSVDRLHFDEAWYGYARFNPLYRERFAMYGDPADHTENDMTIFATQSTHKLLAALTQASFIHIREGRQNISHTQFNESFMMQSSTSPNYPIIASNDITCAMMDGKSGRVLTDESIYEAIAFRQLMSKLNQKYTEQGEWFFDCWQPPEVIDENGERVPFSQCSSEHLATDPDCWILHPGEAWHDFGDIEDGYCMLDPIKVSITTPGISPSGMEEWGIPAVVLSEYLIGNGIVPEKTSDFTVLFLFSMGVTKGKWGTLIDALLRFKDDYDENVDLEECLASAIKEDPKRYADMGLRDLCTEMFERMKELQMTQLLNQAFEHLPKKDMSPVAAYEELVRGHSRRVTLDEAAGHTLATGIIPYPPGIPLIMPGENAGPADGPMLKYLKALEAFDYDFPWFEHENHGIEVEDGIYYVTIIDDQEEQK